MTTTRMPAITATRTIAGHEFCLTVGRRYLAIWPVRPVRSPWLEVTIRDITEECRREPDRTVRVRSYREVGELLAEFNQGPTRYVGRVWTRSADPFAAARQPVTPETPQDWTEGGPDDPFARCEE